MLQGLHEMLLCASILDSHADRPKPSAEYFSRTSPRYLTMTLATWHLRYHRHSLLQAGGNIPYEIGKALSSGFKAWSAVAPALAMLLRQDDRSCTQVILQHSKGGQQHTDTNSNANVSP